MPLFVHSWEVWHEFHSQAFWVQEKSILNRKKITHLRYKLLQFLYFRARWISLMKLSSPKDVNAPVDTQWYIILTSVVLLRLLVYFFQHQFLCGGKLQALFHWELLCTFCNYGSSQSNACWNMSEVGLLITLATDCDLFFKKNGFCTVSVLFPCNDKFLTVAGSSRFFGSGL